MAGPQQARILVVEDEWLIAEQIDTALQDAGYDVVGPVGRLDQALDLLAVEPIDAAVLDINVHDHRSFRIAEVLARRETPFAFISGYAATELPPALAERPLLQKPIDLSALRRCVRSLLCDRQPAMLANDIEGAAD